jgi:amino acid adenylation domain-containing protein
MSTTEPAVVVDVYGLSPMQEGMLFHSIDAPKSGLYFEQFVYALNGVIDVDALDRAWRHAVRRHAVLRTAFVWENVDEPVQVVVDDIDGPAVTVVDVDSRSRDLESCLAEYLSSDRARPFDFTQPPLFRCALLRSGDAHRLVWTFHHLLLDGWSNALLMAEIATLYAAFSNGREPTLPEPRPYRDYIAWLRQQDPRATEAFWRRRLQGFTTPSRLRLRETAARGTDSHTRHSHVAFLTRDETVSLTRFTRQHHLTMNMVLQGAWALALGRYAGRRDVVFGATVSGRPAAIPGIEGMIGLFINTVPVRAHWTGDRAVDDWLRDFQEEQFDAQPHEHASLVAIQGWSAISRGTPLFDSLFAFQNYPRPRVGGEPATTDGARTGLNAHLVAALEMANYPLVLTAAGDAQIGLNVTYDPGHLSDEAAARISRHYVGILRAIASGTAERLDRLSALPDIERQVLLHRSGAEAIDPARTSPTVVESFRDREESVADAVSLVFEGQHVTMATLRERVDGIARSLRRSGVRGGDVVAVCVEAGIDQVVAIVAVLRSGAAYLPIEPTLPEAKIRETLEDARPAAVIARDMAWTGGSEKVRVSPDPEDLAYVLYTSGSTGRPKGVAISHRALANHMAWMNGAFRFTASDRFFFKTAFTFDASVWELMAPLMTGACMVIASGDGRRDSEYLIDTLRDEQVTVLQVVPSLLAGLLEQEKALRGCRALRLLFSGGEPLTADLAGRFRRCSAASIVNLYGPTEATIDSAFWRVEPDRPSVPIGRPVPGARAYVVDAWGDLAPDGVAGELLIGGVPVARGYLRRPALTAEKFVPDPFGPSGARLYRTGDIARWNEGGELEYVGRADHQVKIRGYRIEPAEIEAALAAHADVAAAVVVAAEAAGGDRRLLAYVVPTAAAFNEAQLRTHVEARLPEWMRPARYVRMASFPLTSSGKIDRRALSTAVWNEAEADDAPSLGPTEEIVAGIWREVLGVASIGRAADFFELGGHSLLATQVVARLRRAFDVEVAVRALFEAPTLASLAEHIDAQRRGDDTAVDSPIPATGPGADPAPLSFAQERLWFIDQLEPGNPAYNCPIALRLRGALDVRALRTALTKLQERHEILRTVIVPSGDGAVQQVLPARPVSVPLVDLTLRGIGAAQRLVRRQAAQAFDLQRGPLVRMQIFRLAPDDHVVAAVLHHAVCDLWSVTILIHELSALYAAARGGQDARLQPLPVQYGDYARWQRQWLDRARMDASLAYWKATLAGAPTLDLPTERPRPATLTHRAGLIRLRIDAPVTAALHAVARRDGVTLFMTLLAAWQTVLARASGQDDIVVGTDVANRPRTELEPLIGFFINQVVLRTDLGGRPSFVTLLARVRAVALAAYVHEGVPFEHVVEAVAPARDPVRAPLFQVKLVLQNVRRQSGRLASVQAEPFGSDPTPRIKLDVHLQLTETAAGIVGELTYATDLFGRARMARIGRQLETVLTAVAADPQQSIAALPWLTAGEVAAVVAAGRGPALMETPDVWTLIAREIVSQPDAIALDDGMVQVSYATFGARVRQLASYLRGWGVAPEVRVAVAMPPTAAAIEALVGVLAAGGSYVFVDPATPPARAARLVEAAQCAMVVTTAAMLEQLPAVAMPLLVLEREALAEAPPLAIAPPHPGQLACVIFTSGSTGQPKGVAVTHGSLATYVSGLRQQVPWRRGARIAVVTTLAADLGYTSLYGSLCTGGRLHLIDRTTARDGAALSEWLRAEQIDVVKLPPSQGALLEHTGGGWPHEHLVFGGETLPGRQVMAVRTQGARCAIWNHYGPTECAVGVSMRAVSAADATRPSIPIGTALAGRALYVVDGNGALAAPGVPGELWIGGEGLARGYLDQAALTAAQFRPDPWSATPGSRVYCTGDRLQRGADGALTFLGRRDDQIKIRGYRVAPLEVETALARHPRVAQAAVVPGVTPAGDTCLIAYVVPQGGTAGLEPALNAYAIAELPEYLRPCAYVVLPELPVTANGKLQRDSLPPPIWSAPVSATGPRTPIEELVAGVWADVLGRPVVDVDADFFQLGGHSLLATQVVARLRRLCGVDVPVRVLFDTPTLAALAAAVAGTRPCAAPPPPLLGEPDSTVAPLSFAQQRLWLIDQLEPGHPAYNCPAALRLRGPLHVAAVRASFTTIVARHAVLRSVLVQQDDRVVQQVQPAAPVPLPVIDLAALPSSAAAGVARRLARAEAAAPFDLGRGPLLRARLVRCGPDDHVLLVTLHHVVSDGWSIALLVREFTTLYAATPPGAPAALPPLPIQYADYARWQRTWLQGAALDAQLDYWRTQLAGAPPLHLPADRPRPRRRRPHAGRVPLRVPARLTAALRMLCRREGTTLFMTLLAAFATVLHRLTGQTDLLIATPTANRLTPEIEPLIGFFINLLPLRVDLAGNPPFAEALARVRHMTLDAYAHEGAPFEQIVEAIGTPADSGRPPLGDVSFSLQNMPTRSLSLEAIAVSHFAPPQPASKTDLSVQMLETGDEISGRFDYSVDLFDRLSVVRLADGFLAVLDAVAADPAIPLGAIPLAGAAVMDTVAAAATSSVADLEAEG